MELSKETLHIIRSAFALAGQNGFEYLVPEMILLALAKDEIFFRAFAACKGDAVSLCDDLEEYLNDNVDILDYDDDSDYEPILSSAAKDLINYAGRSAVNSGNSLVQVRHLIHAFWSLEESYAVYYIEKQGVEESELLQAYMSAENETEKYTEPENYTGENTAESGADRSESWRQYAPCLNDTAEKTNPLIGRENELDRTIQILCRKDKNNPLHIGEPGVGKTALTNGLVKMINEGKVPEPLQGAVVFSLDLGGMLAGTQYRGDFEKRFKSVLAAIEKYEKPVIYIDEIHNLAGAGAVGESSFDASNLLKPYLADGHIRFIGATTFEEYKKYFEKNKSLVRRFQNVEISEPSEDEAVKILEGLRSGYEKFHGIKYQKGIMEYAVHMSSRYINERFLPDKAIDLIDEAGAYRKLHPSERKTQTVDKNVINEVLTKICRVPVESVATDDSASLAGLEKRMKDRVFGQDEAVSQVVNAVKYSKAGLLDDSKPLASLLFVGPTGVGKTEIAKSLAAELGIKLIRFDMSEYGEKHAVAKLIGSPAGYVGYEEGGLLTEAVRKTPSAVLLLDEIEKAHADIYNVLLQVMDYATLTDNQGRKADFRNIILIMTSNAGADRLGKSSIGFHSSSADDGVITEAVRNTFQPEFRNRLNRIVVFNGMNEDMGKRVVNRKLSELSAQLSARNVDFSADKKARALVARKGISTEFGAREVDRVIRNEIKSLFVDEMLFGNLKKGGKLALSADKDKFIFTASRK